MGDYTKQAVSQSVDSVTGEPAPDESINGAGHVVDGGLAFRMDTTTNVLYKYFGDALPGTVDAGATWRISRLTVADNTIVWADGNSDFDNVWDNRAALTYS